MPALSATPLALALYALNDVNEGKTKINTKPYSLADVIAELTNIVNISIGEKPIKFSVKTIGSIPSILNGDEVKVYQILMNLLSNAVKYTNEGGVVHFVVEELEGNAPQGYTTIQFRIQDTGIGMSKEFQKKMLLQKMIF